MASPGNMKKPRTKGITAQCGAAGVVADTSGWSGKVSTLLSAALERRLEIYSLLEEPEAPLQT